MRITITIALLICSVFTATSQNIKFPEVDLSVPIMFSYNFRYTDLIHESYKELVLERMRNNSFDTAVFVENTYEDGRLVKVTDSRYLSDMDRAGNLYAKKVPSLITSVLTKYFGYDKQGNLIQVASYETLPSGSYGLLDYSMRNWAKTQQTSNISNKDAQKLGEMFIDSIIRHSPPPHTILKDSMTTSYTSTGNLEMQTERALFPVIRYTYTYDRNRRPVSQRIRRFKLNTSSPAAGVSGYRVATYDDRDRVTSLLCYLVPGDSIPDFQRNQYLRRAQYIHYNTDGLCDTVTYREIDHAYRQSFIYNKSGQPVCVLLCDSSAGNSQSDTVSLIQFQYNAKGQPTEYYRFLCFSKSDKSYLREILHYDANGRLIELLPYSWTKSGEQHKLPLSRHFFFYD